MSTEATPGALGSHEGLGPLVEFAWSYVPSKTWGDPVVTRNPMAAKAAKEEFGHDVQPLYALTPEDVAAVNKAREDAAWRAARRLDLCRCDHTEYCRHCHPLEFRAGGVWGGPNDRVNAAEGRR